MTEGNITYVYMLDILWIVITLINKTSQEEYKEQFWNMTDEQIEQHIGMEGGQHLKMLNENKIKQPNQLTMENYKIIRDEDKYVVVD